MGRPRQLKVTQEDWGEFQKSAEATPHVQQRWEQHRRGTPQGWRAEVQRPRDPRACPKVSKQLSQDEVQSFLQEYKDAPH